MSRLVTFAALAFAWSCASASGSALGGADSKLITFARGLNVLPASSRACPGQVVGAKYEVRIAGGANLPLTESDVATLIRRGTAAEPSRNGEWQTSADPLASAATGFRLSAALARDTTVKGDTVLVPRYGCRPATWDLGGGPVGQQAHVRLGTLRTPFYDSVVVAALEVSGRAPVVALLGPDNWHQGAIRVNAAGKDGRAGSRGGAGEMGSECSPGGDGGDGGDGQDGGAGGHVDIIVEAGSQWLADLVSVYNPGGHGGDGGAAGAGGAPGPSPRGSEKTCSPRPGRAGRPGAHGRDGVSGGPPVVTSVPLSLLWSGSPLWSDSTLRSTLSELIASTVKAGR